MTSLSLWFFATLAFVALGTLTIWWSESWSHCWYGISTITGAASIIDYCFSRPRPRTANPRRTLSASGS